MFGWHKQGLDAILRKKERKTGRKERRERGSKGAREDGRGGREGGKRKYK